MIFSANIVRLNTNRSLRLRENYDTGKHTNDNNNFYTYTILTTMIIIDLNKFGFRRILLLQIF